jgi:hypothetical protein
MFLTFLLYSQDFPSSELGSITSLVPSLWNLLSTGSNLYVTPSTNTDSVSFLWYSVLVEPWRAVGFTLFIFSPSFTGLYTEYVALEVPNFAISIRKAPALSHFSTRYGSANTSAAILTLKLA